MKLTLVPNAGLCNRINAMLCGIYIHQHFGVPLDIYWENTKDCRACFDDLFEPLRHTDIQVKRLKRFYLKPSTKKNLYLPGLLRKFFFSADLIKTEGMTFDFIMEVFDMRNAYVTSSNRFCLFGEKPMMEKGNTVLESSIWTDLRNVSRYFVPQSDIQDKVNRITETYSEHTIGVHIRRTDNISAIQSSPIEKFISRMDEALQKDCRTKFYVASDDIDVKTFLKQRYGDCIIIENNELKRNTLGGMKDAVAELWCLAHCETIYGSNHSTYSTMASRIFNRHFVYV